MNEILDPLESARVGQASKQGRFTLKYIILLLALLLGACSSTSNVNIANTMNLIALAEEKAPNGVTGSFTFLIKATGTRRGEVYLNSESDYRDRRSVTIAVVPEIVSEFTHTYGSPPDEFFLGKTIEVTGEAKRVKINFFANGRPTNKYYFQTHVNVTSIDQINVLG